MEQRSASGALTGGGVGALVGGPIGAVVGAAVGGVGGAAMPEGAAQLAISGLHKERQAAAQVLPTPPQGTAEEAVSGSSSPAASPAPNARVSPEVVKEAQTQLKRDGFYHDRIDGIAGPKTQAALTKYQSRQGIAQTGLLDQATLQHMKLASFQQPGNQQQGANAAARQGASTGAAMLDESQVHHQLQAEGYSNIGNLQRTQSGYTADATQNNTRYMVNIDGANGHVISRRQIASLNQGNAADQESSGSSTMPPTGQSAGSSTPNNAQPQQQ